MNRQQWKDLLEGIGFVAIIGSLYFLALETRNSSKSTELNTQALEMSAYQELINNISNTNLISVQDEDAAKIMLRMRGGSDLEALRLQSAYFAQFRHGDIAYFMYERGAIDENRLRSTLRPLPLYDESGRTFWNGNRANFVDAYQQYVDRLLYEGFWD